MAREKRIANEIVVDAEPEEVAMGWYYSLDDKVKFPFKAKCIAEDKRTPLKLGEEVTVEGMAGENNCQYDMLVDVKWGGKTLAVPLSVLEPVNADADTTEIVGDWHYWVKRGYVLVV
jgi:hypothetical protein